MKTRGDRSIFPTKNLDSRSKINLLPLFFHSDALHTRTKHERVAEALAAFLEIAKEQAWSRRLRWIDKQLRRNPLLSQYIQANHSLESTLPSIRHKVKTLGPAVTIESENEYRLAAFIAGVTANHESLSEKARQRLRGSLMAGLTDPDKKGLINLQHEITVAIHLMDQGFDVHFAD